MATKHPIWPEVTIDDARRLCVADGIASPTEQQLREKFDWLFTARERKIYNEQTDPLRYGYRPSIWFVCMAVLGLDWMIPPQLPKENGELIEGGAAFGEMVRKAFGMAAPWDVVCVLGGNGSAKTHLECYLAMRSLYQFPDVKIQMYHTDSDLSREVHQARMYEFLPPEHRVAQRTESTYIAWKQKTGFSDNSFILPNRSECLFRYYEQKDSKPEGTEPGDRKGLNRCVGYCADELAPRSLIDTLDFRLARFNSVGVLGFTPIEGTTSTVARFLDGGKVLRYGKAFLVPRDNRPPARDLQFQHEDCLEWFRDGQQVDSVKSVVATAANARRLSVEHVVGEAGGTPAVREFALTPRVIQSANPRNGALCFYSDDNRFLDPELIWRKVEGLSEDKIFERYYGFTRRRQAGLFPLFDEDVHSIEPDAIPEKGTNYMIADPSKERNTAMLWVRCTPEEVYVYREWPNQVEAIPGQGFVGPWAEPSDNLKKLDGKKGPAQKNFGWGLCSHKKEIARIEGWECYEARATNEQIKAWKENGPAKEKVEMRLLDARFGNTKGVNEGGQINLFDQFDEIGLTFYESESGSRHSIDDGVQMINDALEYDPDKPVDFFNRPTLRISKDCKNLLFAMSIYTGSDGQHGACKDFIDCLRMFFLKNCRYIDREATQRNRGGGCY